ncbi:MAG: tetratricopeptide repeat protein [Desulfovibrionaceae bacterium]|nr:tetratricopeptide repeat protein [Desulfovibrionaceae bacterium]
MSDIGQNKEDYTDEVKINEAMQDIISQLDLDPSQVDAFRESMDTGEPLYVFLGIDQKEMQHRYALAHHLYAMKKYEDAEDHFSMLCLLSNNSSANWMGLGACRLELGKYDDALNAFTVASVLNGLEDIEPVYWIGICYLRKGDRKTAKDTFRRCLGFGHPEEREQNFFFERAMTILSSLDDVED